MICSNCSKRWVFGNLYKHLKIHLDSYSKTPNKSEQPNSELSSATHNKQQQLINFFSFVKPKQSNIIFQDEPTANNTTVHSKEPTKEYSEKHEKEKNKGKGGEEKDKGTYNAFTALSIINILSDIVIPVSSTSVSAADAEIISQS